MKLFLRYCQKELLFRTLDSGPRCVCSKIADFHFSRALHSRGELSKSSAILTERTNLSSKYETKSVPQLEKLNFDDPKQAYRSKTTWEIARALLVLKLCSVNVLVERNMQVRKIFKVVAAILSYRFYDFIISVRNSKTYSCPKVAIYFLILQVVLFSVENHFDLVHKLSSKQTADGSRPTCQHNSIVYSAIFFSLLRKLRLTFS